MQNCLIIGCGYLGKRVADLWLENGREVSALTRSTETAQTFRERGMIPIVGNVMQAGIFSSDHEFDVVLYAVGFDRQASHSKRDVYVDGLQNVLDQLATRCKRFLYISSTSVYGQTDGGEVDENSPCTPANESGQICLEAEQRVRDAFAEGDGSATILRSAGIYGPQRLLRRITSLRNQEPLAGNPEAWLNLIHVHDLANAVLKSESAVEHELILASDDRPISRREYYTFLAELVEAPEPLFASMTIEEQVAARTTGMNKRCQNQKLREVIGEPLEFPTIYQGLPHAVAASEIV